MTKFFEEDASMEWISDHPIWVALVTLTALEIVLGVDNIILFTKSTHEIHGRLEGGAHSNASTAKRASFWNLIIQILLLDIVFSFNYVITAVGMTNQLGIMRTAVVIAVLFMMVSSRSISDFVAPHPTMKMLALSFLLLIGMTRIDEGLDQHNLKGYVYFFSGLIPRSLLRLYECNIMDG